MKTITDIVYNEYSQALDLYLPESDRFDAVFLYFHGGGLEKGHKGCHAFVPYLVEHNIAVASANYRMYPNAQFPDFIEDSADAVAWVKNHINDYAHCDKLFIGGSSAGGYITMMLCFDERYLGKHGIKPTDLTGYVHDAGQPTAHFNVLREKGLDTRRIIVDETAPLYFIGLNGNDCSPMIFLVSDNDIKNRLEQTMLVLSTMKHFEYDMSMVDHMVLHGGHCHQIKEIDENGDNVFGKIILDFIKKATH